MLELSAHATSPLLLETWGERNMQRNVPFSIPKYELLPTWVECFKSPVLKFGNCVRNPNWASRKGCFQALASRTPSNIFIYLFWQRQRILVVQVMFSLPIFTPQEKKMLVCTHKEQNKREQRKRREGVTDWGNSRLGPEKQGLCC